MTTTYLPLVDQKRAEAEKRAAQHRLVRATQPDLRHRIAVVLMKLARRLTNERDDGGGDYTLAA